MAAQFSRWDPRLKMIGLQFSNVMDPDDYAAFRLSMLTPAATVELVVLYRRVTVHKPSVKPCSTTRRE